MLISVYYWYIIYGIFIANDGNHFLVARRFLANIATQSSAIGSSFALNDFNITLIKLVIWNSQKSNGTHVNVFGI